jgi:hypothetical protein
MLPVPMMPTVMRLLGAAWPRRPEGRMSGAAAAAVARDVVLRKWRRLSGAEKGVMVDRGRAA